MEDGMGYGDRIQVKHEALLTDYTHQSVKVNLARMKIEMELGHNFCVSALADIPSFRRHMHMSKPLYILPQPKIFMRQETHFKMGKPDSISIKRLADNSDYRMGIIRGTTYLPIQVEDYLKNNHTAVVSGSSPIISILKMVDLGRIDWAADYPHIIQWGALSGDIKIESVFTMVEIKELEDSEILRSGVACTKNTWGQKIINQLNDKIKEDAILDIRNWVSKWMPPGDVKEEFFRLNKREFGY